MKVYAGRLGSYLPQPVLGAARRTAVSCSVGELLARGVLGDSRVISGERGLKRVVRTITVLSAPSPEPFIRGGELVLTNGFAYKDDPQQFLEVMKAFAQANSAAIAVHTERYIKVFTEEMIALSNSMGFPLIRLPDDIAWSDIMQTFLVLVQNETAKHSMDFINSFLRDSPPAPLLAVSKLVRTLARRLGCKVAVFCNKHEFSVIAPTKDDSLYRRARLHYSRIGTGHRWEGIEVFTFDVNGSDSSPGLLVLESGASVPKHWPDERFMHSLTLLLSNQMALANASQSARMLRSRILQDIVKREDGERLVSILEVSNQAPVRVVAVGLKDGGQFVEDRFSRALFAEQFERVMHAPTAYVNGRLIGVIRTNELEQAKKRLSRLLANYDTGRELIIGVSSLMETDMLLIAIKEATMCSRATKNDQPERVLCFEQMDIATAIRHGAFDSFDCMLNSTQHKLEHLGRKHPELLQTLETYLACDCSVNSAAARLHIHPSTLKYRLAKIRESIRIDGFDDKVRAYLALRSQRSPD